MTVLNYYDAHDEKICPRLFCDKERFRLLSYKKMTRSFKFDGGGGGRREYPRELDNFENLGLIPYLCDKFCVKYPLEVPSNVDIISC